MASATRAVRPSGGWAADRIDGRPVAVDRARQQVLRHREGGERRGQRREARDGQIERVAAGAAEEGFQGPRCHHKALPVSRW